mmetsp:Transcript_14329/g.34935  ORF Transcript_14329/g.34935 Transcript_14329/m.34935 type:complete len:444 (-) Transcript_14329:316-1647(-)|eukprot:CAMPEP_0114489718 /NCGR_PEP_ID=MMETSP0109-20121206/2042_1 /TAXON_ID=29199 /ORGANISM="Chlorarachnion reptans, Strain CCCM449" /LENGTH=443 /DNA_ID=CAMNT_0001666255 /DNA_START=76 /DNA_END=1407 /DNA_ORIENTATION=-
MPKEPPVPSPSLKPAKPTRRQEATVHSHPEACRCAVFDDVLRKEDFVHLRGDFIRVVNARAHDAFGEERVVVPDNENAFVTGTYWYPLRERVGKADENQTGAPEGKHGVELAIKCITSSLKGQGGVLKEIIEASIGCEWWFQEQGPEDLPKEFHTDVNIRFYPDEPDEAKKAEYHYPLLSSVFYFGTSSPQETARHPHLLSPTVVFGQAPKATNSIEHILSPAIPTRAVCCYPSPNRLLVFQGNLWHAVVSPCRYDSSEKDGETKDLTSSETTAGDNLKAKPKNVDASGWEADTRYTLLINWWDKRPEGPEKMRTPGDGKSPGYHEHPSFTPVLSFSPRSSLSASSPSPPDTLVTVQVDEKKGPNNFALSAFMRHAQDWKNQIVPKTVQNCVPKNMTFKNGKAGPVVVIQYPPPNQEVLAHLLKIDSCWEWHSCPLPDELKRS